MKKYKKVSTLFFCPRCKREDKVTRMLTLEPNENYLTCDIHKDYKKICNCGMSDIIIFQEYPDSEEETIKMVEEAEDYISNEDQEEEEMANTMRAVGDSFVVGFDLE